MGEPEFLEDGKMLKVSERKARSGFQFVWWGWKELFSRKLDSIIWGERYHDPDRDSWAYIYAWRLILGPFENFDMAFLRHLGLEMNVPKEDSSSKSR